MSKIHAFITQHKQVFEFKVLIIRVKFIKSLRKISIINGIQMNLLTTLRQKTLSSFNKLKTKQFFDMFKLAELSLFTKPCLNLTHIKISTFLDFLDFFLVRMAKLAVFVRARPTSREVSTFRKFFLNDFMEKRTKRSFFAVSVD
jgi:hypothetical protein